MGLEVLAQQVMTHFELRRNRIARQEEQKQLYQFQCALQALQEQVKESFQTPLAQAMLVLQHPEYHALKEKVKEGIAQFTQSGIALETKIESLLHSAVFGR